MYYETKKIGDEIFMKKIKEIKKIINQIKEFNLKKKIGKKLKKKIEEKQKRSVVNILKNWSSKNDKENTNNSEDEDEKEENELLNLENALDSLLTQDCPLCGNEMILSTQIKFRDENNNDWNI